MHEKVQSRINNVINSGFNIVVGDANGADRFIQEHLHACHADKVTVYYTGEVPRNNVGDWPVHHVQSKAKVGSREFFATKDLEMAKISDYGLMIWDCESTGTLSNIIEMLKKNKKSLVFINKNTDFVTVSDRNGLDHILNFMTHKACAKAEGKIGLSDKIAELKVMRLF